MSISPAKPTYSQTDEQSYRNEVARQIQQAVRADVAVPFLLMIDQDTGEVGKLTVESGVVTWTTL